MKEITWEPEVDATGSLTVASSAFERIESSVLRNDSEESRIPFADLLIAAARDLLASKIKAAPLRLASELRAWGSW